MRTRWRSRSSSHVCGFINFDPASGFPRVFLIFFLGSWVGSGFPLASLSLEGTGTGSRGRVTCLLIAGGQDKIGMAEIGISPSKRGTDEMKLSKASIQIDMM
jgi:hypothetical protein